jgi:hypothetical protein
VPRDPVSAPDDVGLVDGDHQSNGHVATGIPGMGG